MSRPHFFYLRLVIILTVFAMGIGGSLRPAPAVALSTQHPIVGSWQLNSDEAPQHALALFGGDGTVLLSTGGQSPMIGSWESIGPYLAAFTAYRYITNETGTFVAAERLQGLVEVVDVGEQFLMRYSLDTAGADGQLTLDSEIHSLVGSRITVDVDPAIYIYPDATPASTPNGP